MGIDMIAVLMAFGVSCVLSAWFSSEKSPLRLWDTPNERSLHTRPTPSSGGGAILAGIMVGWLFAWPGSVEYLWVVAAMLVVASVSFVDDLRALPPLIRLVAHLVAAALLVVGKLRPDWDGILAVLLVLAATWMINLYNFMDGMDGLAGGMALFGFGFMGVAGYMAGDPIYATTCWVIAAAATGFLVLNFHPARLFMGDTGATSLGLLAVAMALIGVEAGVFALWFPLLVFSPFIVDATVTLLRRIMRGEKVWQAHCSHYYQRLVRLGWGHARTALAEYLLMAACGFSALAMLSRETAFVAYGLGVWAVVYLVLVGVVHRLEGTRMHTQPGRDQR